MTTDTDLTTVMSRALRSRRISLLPLELSHLWRAQLEQRPPFTPGLFGPPGWLLRTGVADAVAELVDAPPEFHEDIARFAELPRESSLRLLQELPAPLLDCPEACGPTTRALLQAAARNPQFQPFGYIVGPDRADERVMCDGFMLFEPSQDALGASAILQLLERHDWEMSFEDPAPRVPEEEAAADPELSDLAMKIEVAQHCSYALAELWEVARERYGLGSASHPPEEITLVRGGGEARIGLRMWWRWGNHTTGCPTDGGTTPGSFTLPELTRRLPRLTDPESPGQEVV